MKKLICFFLVSALVLSLWGCTQPEENTCTFYYLRTGDTIAYGREDALIAPVSRELAGQNADLNYLLQLYLEGPVEDTFQSPIPRGTYLLSSLWDGDTLVLVLSREFSTLDHMQLTLAGACLAATCHALAGAEKIQVRSGEAVYEFDLKNYSFLDTSGQ